MAFNFNINFKSVGGKELISTLKVLTNSSMNAVQMGQKAAVAAARAYGLQDKAIQTVLGSSRMLATGLTSVTKGAAGLARGASRGGIMALGKSLDVATAKTLRFGASFFQAGTATNLFSKNLIALATTTLNSSATGAKFVKGLEYTAKGAVVAANGLKTLSQMYKVNATSMGTAQAAGMTLLTVLDNNAQAIINFTKSTQIFQAIAKGGIAGAIGVMAGGLGKIPGVLGQVSRSFVRTFDVAKGFAATAKGIALTTKTGQQLNNVFLKYGKHIKTVRNIALAWNIANSPLARQAKAVGLLAKNADNLAKAVSLYRFGALNMAGPASLGVPQIGGAKAILAYFAQAEAAAKRGLKLSSEQFKATILLIRNWRLIAQSIAASYTALSANMAGYELIDINMVRIKRSWKASEATMNRFRDTLDDIGKKYGFLRADIVASADTLAVVEKQTRQQTEQSLKAIAAMAVRGNMLLADATQAVVDTADAIGSKDMAKVADQLTEAVSVAGGSVIDMAQSLQLVGREITGAGTESGEEMLALVALLQASGADAQQAGGELVNVLNRIQGKIQEISLSGEDDLFSGIDLDTDIGDVLLSATGAASEATRKVAQVFTTATGGIRSLMDALPDLKQALMPYSEAEQGIILRALFGDSSSTVRQLLSFTEEEVTSLIGRLQAQVGSGDLPEGFENSYAAALQRVAASLDSIAIKISEALTPIATFLLNFSNFWLRILDNIPTPIEKLLRVAAGFIPVLTLIGTIIFPIFRVWTLWKVALPLLLAYINALDKGIRAYQHLGKEQKKLGEMTQKGLRIQAQLESKIQKLQEKRLQNLRDLQKAQVQADRAQFNIDEARSRGATDPDAERNLAEAQKQIRDLTNAQAELNRQIGVAEQRYQKVGNAIVEQRKKVARTESGAMVGEATMIARERLPREADRLEKMREKQQRAIAAIEERKTSLKQRQVQLAQQLLKETARLEEASKTPRDPKSEATIRDAQSRIAQLQAEQSETERYYQRAEQGQERINGLVSKQQGIVDSLIKDVNRQGRTLDKYQDKMARVIGTTMGRIENGTDAYLAASDKIREIHKGLAGDVKNLEKTKLQSGIDLITQATQNIFPDTNREIGENIRAEMGRTVKTVAGEVSRTTVDLAEQAALRSAGAAGTNIEKAFKASATIREQAEATAQRRIEAYDKRRADLERRADEVRTRIAKLEGLVPSEAKGLEKSYVKGLQALEAQAKVTQERIASLASQAQSTKTEANIKRRRAEQQALERANQQTLARQAGSGIQGKLGELAAKPYQEIASRVKEAARVIGQQQQALGRIASDTMGRVSAVTAKPYQDAKNKLGALQKESARIVSQQWQSMGRQLDGIYRSTSDLMSRMYQDASKKLGAAQERAARVIGQQQQALGQTAGSVQGKIGAVQKDLMRAAGLEQQALSRQQKGLERQAASIQSKMSALAARPYQDARRELKALQKEAVRIAGQQRQLANTGRFAAARYEADLQRAKALQATEQRRLDIAKQMQEARQKLASLDSREKAATAMPLKQAEAELSAVAAERANLQDRIGALGREAISAQMTEGFQKTAGKAYSVMKTGIDRIAAYAGKMSTRAFTLMQLGATSISGDYQKAVAKVSTPVVNAMNALNKGIGTTVKMAAKGVVAIANDIMTKINPTVSDMANDVAYMVAMGLLFTTAAEIFNRITKASKEARKNIRAIREDMLNIQKLAADAGLEDLAKTADEIRLEGIREDMGWLTRSLDFVLTNSVDDFERWKKAGFWGKLGLGIMRTAPILAGRAGVGIAQSEQEGQAYAYEETAGKIRESMVAIRSQFEQGLLDPDSSAGRAAIEFLQKNADLLAAMEVGFERNRPKADSLATELVKLGEALKGTADGAADSGDSIKKLGDVMAALEVQTGFLDSALNAARLQAYEEFGNDAEALNDRLLEIDTQGQKDRLVILENSLKQARLAETDNIDEKYKTIKDLETQIAELRISIAESVVEAAKRQNQEILDAVEGRIKDELEVIKDAADLKRLAILEDESLTAEEREKALDGAEDDLRDLQLEKTRERLKELQDLGVLSTAEEEEQRLASIEEAEDEITQLRIQKAEERAAALDEIQELESGRAEEKLDAEKELQEEIAQGRIDLQDELFQNEKEFALEQQKEREEFELDLQERRATFQEDQQKAQADFEKQQQEEKAQFEKDLQKELEDLRKTEEERIIDQAIEREKELALAKSEAERAELRKKYKEEDEQRAKELEAELKASEEVEKNRDRILSDAEKSGVLDVELSATELRRQGEEQAQKEAEFAQQQLDAAEEFKAQQEQEALDFEQEIQDSQAEFEQGQRDAEIEFLESQRQLQLDFENESRQQWADFWNEQRKLDRDNAEAIAKIREREGIATRLEQLQANMAAQERQKKIYESYLNAAATNTDPNIRYDPASLERARGWIAQSEAAIKAIADQVAAEQQRMGQIDAELNAADQRPTLATLDDIAMSEREVELREQQAAERAATQDFNAQERERDAQHRAEQRRLDRENADQIYSIYNQPGNIVDLGGLPARREGGPVAAGQTYLVGEEGPELFTPGRAGGILPADQTAALMGGLLSNRPNIYAPTPATESLRELQQIRKALSGLKPGVGSQQISIRNSYQPDGGSTAAMVERSQLDLLRQLQKTLG